MAEQKLTLKDRRTIYERLRTGEKGSNLAREYGVSRQLVSSIGTGNLGKHHEAFSIQIQIEATIWLVERHVTPTMNAESREALRGYLDRLARTGEGIMESEAQG